MWRIGCRMMTTSLVARRNSPRVFSTADASFHQRIVSRRALQEYNKQHPKPKTTSSQNKKEEKTEWPRSMKIAGYVAAAVGIPYSVLLFVSSNAPVREASVDYVPSLENVLRTYFGSPEEDELTYVEIKEGESPHYILPGEPCFVERMQQERVHDLQVSPTPVRITLYKDGQPFLSAMPKHVPGWTLARPDVLMELAGEKMSNDMTVAVDFDDLKPHHHDRESTTIEEPIVTFEETRQSPKFFNSYWYYQPPTVDTSSSSIMSVEEVEISRLEYEIQQLEADLKDVNCTRNVDDMQRELKEAKSELRKIKWKRRLRLK